MAKLFDEAIRVLAKVYSKDLSTDLTIEYDGLPSYDVKNHVMHLPYQISDEVPEELENEFRVFLGHESGERRWRKLTPDMIEACKNDPCLKMWFNSIGDVSLEEEQADDFPGLGLLMTENNKKILDHLMNRYSKQDEPDHSALSICAQAIGYGLLTADQIKDRLNSTWHPYVDLCDRVMSGRQGSDIREAFELSQTLRKEIDLLWEDENPPPEDGEEEGEGEGRGMPMGETDMDEERQNKLTQALQKHTGGGKWGEQHGTAISYTFTDKYDVYCEARHYRQGAHVPLNDQWFRREADMLYTKMRQALTVPVPKNIRRRLKGSLDERRIAQLCIGRNDVFTRRLPQPDLSVAAVLSFDLSGSVSHFIPDMKVIAATWNDAFGRMDVPLAIQGWGTCYGGCNTETVGGEMLTPSQRCIRLQAESQHLYRREPIDFVEIKRFDQGWQEDATKINIATIPCVGSTPTGEGLFWAVRELRNRPERRKLLFFVTDGGPGFMHNGASVIHYRMIKNVAKAAVANGIEIYPIGVDYNVNGLFEGIPLPASAVLNSAKDLLRLIDTWIVDAFRDMANTAVQHRIA